MRERRTAQSRLYVTETGQDAHVGLLTGRPTAHRSTVSATKTYSLVLDYVFQPKIFAELQNAQAIVLPYDGLNPHGGTLSTIHANSAPQALARLASCVMQSGIDLPYQAVRQQIGDSIHFVLHLERSHGRRTVTGFLRIERYDPHLDKYDTDLMRN